jgi:hypothetical protein
MISRSKQGASSLSSHDNIEEALNRSELELARLVNIYHQQGLSDRAHEIYRTILGIRGDKKKRNAEGD